MIAVIADTHLPRGRRQLPARCLELLRSARLIVHAGDISSLATLEVLETLAPVAAVHGNVDEPAVRARLPARLVVEAEGLRLGIVHDAGPDAGRHERLRSWFPGCGLVVYGHSHRPELTCAGGVWVLNPGSPTERRREPSHTMAVVRAGRPSLVDLD